MLAALVIMLATADDPRVIGAGDAKSVPRLLNLAKRCRIRATTEPLPFNPNAQIPIQWYAILADVPIKESDPRFKCFNRLVRTGVPVVRNLVDPR